MAQSLTNLAYIAAAALFVLGIKMLGSADTARRGNILSSCGMLIAVVATLIGQNILSFHWVTAALVTGGAIGALAARIVRMTSMPEMVALFNGFGGLASLLVGWAEYEKLMTSTSTPFSEGPYFASSAIFLTVFIGGITFTGSLLAYGKLAGRVTGRAVVFPLQRLFNALVLIILLSCGLCFVASPGSPYAYPLLIAAATAALSLGILGVLPIGGGDMPVVISFLNSCSGLAAAAAGFVILNNVLIVAGCLVGASGFVLTTIMCKAMNRSLANVLFSGFGSSVESTAGPLEGEMKPISVSDAFYVLEAARNVLIVPGYGMAVAQAQHVARELGDLLERNGAEVRYAIHPVAGRMPGHMNVLLAEADVPYEQLVEMEAANPTISAVDVALVIGANDVVNPAAIEDPNSPIFGMPIINVHLARTVFALKRGQGTGFSGLANNLFFRENTRMIYGDAKATVSALVSEFDN